MQDRTIQIVDSNYEYRGRYPKYEFLPSEWRYLPKEEIEVISETSLQPPKKKGEIWMLMELWELHLINHFEISFILEPVKFFDSKGVEENNLMEYYEQVRSFYDDTSPVYVYISYPFAVDIEFKVFPITRIKETTLKMLDIGYLAWQVSKLFERLFKDEGNSADFDISGLTEFQLTSFHVFENNIFVLEVNH